MRPALFEVERPHSLPDAIAAVAERGARPLAGGQSLIAQLTRRELAVDRLVDLAGVGELRQLTVLEDGSLSLGAMVTVATLEDDERITAGWPLLATAARHVGHRPIRNRSTVGGCIAFGDPPAEVPLALAVLGADIERIGGLITGVTVPPCHGSHGFHEVSRRLNDRAVAVAAVVLDAGDPCNGRLGFATAASWSVLGPHAIPNTLHLLEGEAGGEDYSRRALREAARRAVADASRRAEAGDA
ncbi:MAG: FAD binding domain-containing protein [Solirubrobacteraceae bacterium]